MRTYSELILLSTFKERFEYLKLDGRVGEDTFGFDRWLNQQFYNSKLWKDAKREVIIRDNGCDLGLEEYEVHGRILVHHMNPIDKDDILRKSDILLNPEYLISVCKRTHDAIHYGDFNLANQNGVIIERKPNDTCPWKK